MLISAKQAVKIMKDKEAVCFYGLLNCISDVDVNVCE